MSTTLTVGIDVTPILYNRGVSRYTTNIIRAMGALPSAPRFRFFGSSFRAHRQLKMLSTKLSGESHITTKPTILAFPPSFLSRMWYGVKRLHIESLMQKVDVFHAWEELIPPSYKTPIVATIHDLALFKFNEIAHPQTKEKHTQALKRLIETNSHVIAVSQQTKRDLMELFSFREDRIHVIPEAMPTESIVAPSQILSREELRRFTITRPYFLWVGVNEPRKNLDRIIAAWKSYRNEYDLVLVGSTGLQSFIPEQGMKIIQNAKMDELASLYTHASVFLFPSLYEGFGLPILESFYYGCPVVTSNNSGMSETAGDAAYLVDAFDVDSITAGIKKALEQGRMKASQEKMKKRLACFSWEESAKLTLQVYKLAKLEGK